jgi:hypothetical protein
LSREYKYFDWWDIYRILSPSRVKRGEETVELVKNLCLSCKEVYDSDNITAEQQDVNDKNFCPACWEQLKTWDDSKHS